MSLSRAMTSLLTVAAMFIPAVRASAGQAGAGVPDVRLEAHDGKTSFYLGEPMRLDLIFENRTGSPFLLNDSGDDDLSEEVEITPASGWLQWQTRSASDSATVMDLDAAPVRIPVWLDEGFLFREPGEYRVRVTTARLTGGSMRAPISVPPVTTNEITIKLEAMPEEMESAKLDSIRADLASAPDADGGDDKRTEALHELAALQGELALAEKVKLLEDGDDDFRKVYREAFATTRDLQKQLALLEEAWTDPKLTPRYDTPNALDETRRLLAGRNLGGWQPAVARTAPDAVEQRLAAEHRADMVALLDSMPQHAGESRTMAAYFLVDFGGLPWALHARAVEYAVEAFPHMDDIAQHMLIEGPRPLRDRRLVPALQSMLAGNPADKDVTAALLAIAPEQSSEWIVTSVCAPKGVVPLDTFNKVSVDRMPEVDACLTPLLRSAPSNAREEFEWKQRAAEAARFATPGILSAVREGWKSSAEDSAALAVLMRDDPAGAIELLNKAATAGTLNLALLDESRQVYEQLRQPLPPEVREWLRSELNSAPPKKEASAISYALSIGGDASDAAQVKRPESALPSP